MMEKFLYLHNWVIYVGAAMLALYCVFYFMEWKHPKYRQLHVTHSYTCLAKGSINIFLSIGTAWLMASYLQFVGTYFTGLLPLATSNVYVQAVSSILLIDMIMYFWHRINHIFPSLWKFHAFHHAEKELNIFSTFHFHPIELTISTLWKIIVFPLLGILPAGIIINEAIFFMVILFHHSNVKLNFGLDKILGKIIVTPGIHHIHHSVKIEEANSNYGSIFSFWDKLFRSHTPYTDQPIKFGL